jgi:RNA polymerase sigma factor (sigma-70 family)
MEFAEIYDQYFDRIYAYVRCRVATGAEAEDICSAAFGKALENFAQYDPARGEPVQWLFGIARNEVNYHLRRSALISFLPLDLFGDIFKDRATPVGGDAEETRELSLALEELESKERDLVSLKFYSELNNREIARLTGLSESNVGTILYRCMAKLRKKLAPEVL